MTDPGKRFPGQKGFPTPNDVPETNGYIVFRFPNSNEWAGLLMGAAQLLAEHWNYTEWGALTPNEAAEAWRAIVDQAPYSTCGCTLPGGHRIIRLAASGHVEELAEDGTWSDPTGDYAVPPVSARTGGTSQDQICLAAANCANVLLLLYENLTDSWNSTLEEAEALAALAALLVTLIGAEFAPITFAIAQFFLALFGTLYTALAYIGADAWSDNFTKQLICILVECATNDAGIVTFDYSCFNEKLATQTDAFDLTSAEIRLYVQIQYMMSFIGGVDALNHAAASTALSSADCSDCAQNWCYEWDFTASDGGFSDNVGEWVSGLGWHSVFHVPSGGYILRALTNGGTAIATPAHGYLMEVHYSYDAGTGNNGSDIALFYVGGVDGSGVSGSGAAGSHTPFAEFADEAFDKVEIELNSVSGAGYVAYLLLRTRDEIPEFEAYLC